MPERFNLPSRFESAQSTPNIGEVDLTAPLSVHEEVSADVIDLYGTRAVVQYFYAILYMGHTDFTRTVPYPYGSIYSGQSEFPGAIVDADGAHVLSFGVAASVADIERDLSGYLDDQVESQES